MDDFEPLGVDGADAIHLFGLEWAGDEDVEAFRGHGRCWEMCG